MTMTLVGTEIDPQTESAVAEPAVAPRITGVRLWVWLPLSLILLGSSGLFRTWQDRRLEEITTKSEPPPFPLKELPQQLEGWRLVEGGEQQLDPQIARIAGSSDHLIRTYANEQTGVTITVLLIYGQGQYLSQHVPEVCYPNTGFIPADEATDREVLTNRGYARFRSLAFAKLGGAGDFRDEVYYSFRHEGRWYPDAAADWKRLRQNPSMFKLQLERRLAPRERRHIGNPTEQFLSVFLPVLERRIAGTPKSLTGTAESADSQKK
jgi:hypothetical protein